MRLNQDDSNGEKNGRSAELIEEDMTNLSLI